jgi:transposase
MACKLGVDVSKAKLDVALLTAGGKFRSKVFTNDGPGFKSLLAWIESNVPDGKRAVHVCMEATGVYHEGVALFLHDQQVTVSVVNPLLVKRFAEINRLRNKTDGGDAKCLARFCEMTQPELWEAPSPSVRALQALVTRLDTLLAMRQGEVNRLDVAHGSVKSSIQHVIASLDSEIEQVRAQIRQTIDDDPELKQRDGLLQSIPGLGERTIPQLLAYIGRPERFKSVKALIAYASLTPMIVGHIARPADRNPPAWPPRTQASALLSGDGGGQVQPARRRVLESTEGTKQAWQGHRRGVHAQAAGHRLRRIEVEEAIQSRPPQTHERLTGTTVSLLRSTQRPVTALRYIAARWI